MAQNKEVSLGEIAGMIKSSSKETGTYYLEKRTGEPLLFTNGKNTMPGGKTLEAVKASPEYAEIPGADTIPEFSIRERFAETLEESKACDKLLEALFAPDGRSGFYDALHAFDLVDRYEAYFHGHFLRIAEEWCRANGVPCRTEKAKA